MIRSSGFGEVYKAFDKTSNDYMAIKKLRLIAEVASLENESRILRNCRSKYIVGYYDAIQMKDELWVGAVVSCERV